MKYLTEYLGAVKVLLANDLASSIEEAMTISKVPLELRHTVALHFGKDVSIKEPSILKNDDLTFKLLSLKPQSSWTYTEAYGRFLTDIRGWSTPGVVEGIIDSSSKILERFPDPSVPSFKSKGLVVGYVQSGKTASMASLINLAADHGYKFVIVLAGLLKDLRLQTQNRLDQEVTGKSEVFKPEEMLSHNGGISNWVRLTNADINSDFRPGTTEWDANESTPKLIVMKKIPVIIDSLVDWIKKSPQMDLSKFPTLIIDDESDHATIDTKYDQVDDEGNPVPSSTTNAAIRRLVDLFPKCVYVGYTATPFANFFIDSAIEDELYPKDFICVLDEPIGYWGARQLFGLGMSASMLSPEEERETSVNLIETICPNEVASYNQDQSDCPPFLRKAIYSFILTSLARLARGQDGPGNHFSMLVHPSRLKNDHEECRLVIENEINFIKKRIQMKALRENLLSELRKIWDDDFIPKTRMFNSEDCPVVDFDTIWNFQKNFFDNVEVIALNSNHQATLDYNSKTQKMYIVVGGDKLSRGLTLEGLCISVFFRNLPSAYDTALQMGRWFGYRKGYFDLTRVFVEKSVASAFADLARVELELRNDLEKYSKEPNPLSPSKVFPLVRSHPVMAVTSRLKLGASVKRSISFQGRVTQTVSFPFNDVSKLRENIEFVRVWLKDIGRPVESKLRKGTYYFKNVPADTVINFLKEYNFSPDAREVNSSLLINYISAQVSRNEITNWDIILPVGTLKNPSFSWMPEEAISTHTVNRSKFGRFNDSIKVLSEAADLDTWRKEFGRDRLDPSVAGLFLYVIDKNSYADNKEKSLFDKTAARDDVLGFAIDFPRSNSLVTAQYQGQG